MSHQPLFTPSFLKDRLKNFHLQDFVSDFEKKKQTIIQWQKGFRDGSFQKKKETTLDADFMNDIFGEVLGYEHHIGKGRWNLEKKYSISGKEADGVLGYFSNPAEDLFGAKVGKSDLFLNADVRVILELKSFKTDLSKKQNRLERLTPIEQAFGYANKAGESCKWIIVSNFNEIRLYNKNIGEEKYETFYISQLDNDFQLKRFFYLLSYTKLFLEKQKSTIELAIEERQLKLQEITKKFYAHYKKLRLELFENLRKENSQYINKEAFLLEKTQKILDRILFICFCEWLAITPSNLLQQVITNSEKSFGTRENKIWTELQGLFQSLDKGFPPHINKFNGGLFREDKELDNLNVTNWMLERVLELRKYDYSNDLTVDILGHIFEQSISDIEEIHSKFSTQLDVSGGQTVDAEIISKKDNQRKKEGIFYTPEYITTYIVKEAVGAWLDDRKKEFGFDNLPELSDEEKDTIKLTKLNTISSTAKNPKPIIEKIKKHTAFWLNYREAVKNIKILDPACGSGAFLVKVFDLLKKEFETINKSIAELKPGQQPELFDLDKHILTNNIFGVDLNPASVEITQLSLWLKTADRSKELTTLDNNIQCGNSLIDDKKIVGDLAFVWNKRFKKIMDDGGFDVIVGNPPYVVINKINLIGYDNYEWNSDLYLMFIELSLKKLLKMNSYFGFITPRFYLVNKGNKSTRQFLLSKVNILSLTETSPFEDAHTECIITIIKNKKVPGNYDIPVFVDVQKQIIYTNTISNEHSLHNENYEIITFLNTSTIKILKKIENESISLNDKAVSFSKRGMEIGKQNLRKLNDGVATLIGQDVSKYNITFEKTYIDNNNKEYKRLKEFFKLENVVYLRRVAKGLIATVSDKLFAFNKNIYGIFLTKKYHKNYIVALLNSKLLNFYYINKFSTKKGDLFPEIQSYLFEALPIKNISAKQQQPFIDKVELLYFNYEELGHISYIFPGLLMSDFNLKEVSPKINKWYFYNWQEIEKEIMKLRKRLFKKSESEDWLERYNRIKTRVDKVQEIIKQTEKEIDNMVYELYELTPEEIKIVKGEN